jgi:hypothetical protein
MGKSHWNGKVRLEWDGQPGMVQSDWESRIIKYDWGGKVSLGWFSKTGDD